MTLHGRQLNLWVLVFATAVVIAVHSVGLARDWFAFTIWNLPMMFAVAYGCAWVTGRRIEVKS